MTNGDKIRLMNDKDLVKFILSNGSPYEDGGKLCSICSCLEGLYDEKGHRTRCDEICVDGIEKWIRSEYE